MITPIHKVSKNLAANVSSLRKKKHMTQGQLAELSGATRASISLIESGTSNPTLEVMLKLSSALQISIDELTSSPRADCKHISARDVPLDRRTKKGLKIRKLLPDKVGSTEMDEISLEPGQSFAGTPHIEGTREYFTCIEGEITVSVFGETFVLKEGDVLAFPGDKPHSYKNQGKKSVKGFSVVLFNPS